MLIFYSDLHVETLARGLLAPGEQLVARTAGEKTPWWGVGLVRRSYLVLASAHRLFVLEHRWSLLKMAPQLTAIHTLALGQVDEIALKGIFNKKLVIKAMQQGLRLAFKVPRGFFQPTENNLNGARSVVATREQQALPAAPAAHGLPYGAQPTQYQARF
jgi:hypothetical protein